MNDAALPPDPARTGRRRALYFSGAFALTALLTWFQTDLLWRDGITAIGVVLTVLFSILSGLLSLGFMQALLGFRVLASGDDPRRILARLPPVDPRAPLAPTAIVLPIHNEDVTRTLEGLRAVYRSVEATGRLAHFDFFILSDSSDPNHWIEEEVAWLELCKQLGAFGRIFYRKRRQPINRKSGNVADFLRRWGRRYRYMVVLDADSLMTGDALVTLVRAMEAHPQVGIIQTAPQLVRAETPYARLQQFAARLYGPLYAAGLNYWQQSEGNFWGHNAIIRVAPFIEHCSLPDLPGEEPFGGRILSHDYVEAALMRRAGFEVWLAHDLEGSFEEGPPTLIDALKRDRRWCQGNLQHAWLLTARGLRPINRLHLALGILAYIASPLWFLFLVLSTFEVHQRLARGADALPYYATPSAFWNVPAVPQALALFALVLVLLLGPKILALARALRDSASARGFGGRGRLLAGVAAEVAVSALLAPVLMVFHSRFVVYTLLGQGVSWVAQNRSAAGGVDWREAILTHAAPTLFGLVWGVSTWVLARDLFVWLLPVVLGLVLGAPLSIALAKPGWGQHLRRARFWSTPEDNDPPEVLARLERNLARMAGRLQPLPELRAHHGLLQAVLDPYINAVHVALLRQRRHPDEEARAYFAALRTRLLREGPGALERRHQIALLFDPESMVALHEDLWRTPARELADWWQLALRQYNVLTRQPATALYR